MAHFLLTQNYSTYYEGEGRMPHFHLFNIINILGYFCTSQIDHLLLVFHFHSQLCSFATFGMIISHFLVGWQLTIQITDQALTSRILVVIKNKQKGAWEVVDNSNHRPSTHKQDNSSNWKQKGGDLELEL